MLDLFYNVVLFCILFAAALAVFILAINVFDSLTDDGDRNDI